MPELSRPRASSRERRPPRRLRVLVADDHADTVEGYRTYLETVGVTVQTATDGAMAVYLARTTLPDVIVLDVRMPGIDGRDVVRLLRVDKATAGIPIILLSGALPADEGQAKLWGADAAVMKPCLPADLFAVLRRYAGRA
jgi:CheY-like chemotaxis protein